MSGKLTPEAQAASDRYKWAEEVRASLAHWLDVRKRAIASPNNVSIRNDYARALRRLETAGLHFLGRSQELGPPRPPTLERLLEESLRLIRRGT